MGGGYASSPGWIRTSDLSHVKGTSCPLNDGTDYRRSGLSRPTFGRARKPNLPIPRPGFEPGTPRSKRGMIVRFTIGASSGRQGSRTLISVWRTALAGRPGQPYPATFHQWTHRESNPDFPSAERVSSRWTMSPANSGPRGSRTLISGVRSRRRPVGPAARTVIPDGLEPSLPGCGPGVFAAGPRDQCSSRGGNRTHRQSPGSRPGRFTGFAYSADIQGPV